ncbi:putative RNA-binding protein C3H8.09c [Golovinomyces cichoracearum]|uniref:Putative RNA-binding protein C3H8.09c n=1 Tax=Golovinomyces cichoracearum TaxID=62708 RepID=A0A420J2Q8_9PEZI|nr:putative RNA-binding protein C3H8.09c [Golovinomyces cichoracearum]
MTSTDFKENSAVAVSSEMNSINAHSSERHDSPQSSFSDAYNEDAEMVHVKNGESTQIDDNDYAMTFDSDGDEHTDRQKIQVISEAKIEPEAGSLPSNVSATNSSSNAPPGADTSKIPFKVTTTHPPHLNHTSDQNSDAVASNIDTTNTAQTTVIEPLGVKPQNFNNFTAGGIDIQQLLDNITANAEKPESAHLKNHSLPIHASLPPRPNVPQTRIYQDEGPKYYAGTPGLPPASTSYRPPGGAPSLVAAGAPGTSTDPRSGLPPPPTASFRGQLSSVNSTSLTPNVPVNRLPMQELSNLPDQGEADDSKSKWAPEVQKMYDDFLEDERRYVTEGLWDRFPMGSRLFIGNLPSEKVTKRDLFHIFYHYGKIAQISIKQAYGFVQFLHNDHCYKALDCEQGAEVRGRKMHLEISKPQKNARNAQHNSQSSGQRIKSPDRKAGGRNGRGNDRYDRQTQLTRADEYGRPIRARDDFRPVRSVSPPRGITRARDTYPSNLRDPYDSQERRRSRSPYGHRDAVRYRDRSPSPRLREGVDEVDLLIPRRDPRDVPDVQIILMEQLDRQFVSWVENEMRSRGISTEVMFLSARLPIKAVIRRQILEGVIAVTRLSSTSQNSSKIPLQVFDRQGGANNVKFDEYEELEPKIAGELVLRAKQSQATPQAQAPPYPQTQFSHQTYQAPAVSDASNLANLVGSLDNATLQKLLGTLNTTQQQLPIAASPTIDLAGLLGGLKHHSTSQNYVPPPQTDIYTNSGHVIQNQFRGNNVQNAINSTHPQPAQQVQNIMAQLARFRQ